MPHLGPMLPWACRRVAAARAGKPMAALVPVTRYEEWQKGREALLEFIGRLQERNRDADPAEIAREVAAAVRATRKRK